MGHGGSMALYSASAKVIKRSEGRSATGAAAYRSGEAIHDARLGLTHDFTRRQRVSSAEILAPADAPDWALDRSELWNQVEKIERRKDAQVAREFMVALPHELDAGDQQALATEFARRQFVDRGMVADVCCHNLGEHNPHAHIMLTTRTIGPDGFGGKERAWNDKKLLAHWRESWATATNEALERQGSAARVDHRTLEAQGIEREPTIHHGGHAIRMERNRAIEQQNERSEPMTRPELELTPGEVAALPEPSHTTIDEIIDRDIERDLARHLESLEHQDDDQVPLEIDDDEWAEFMAERQAQERQALELSRQRREQAQLWYEKLYQRSPGPPEQMRKAWEKERERLAGEVESLPTPQAEPDPKRWQFDQARTDAAREHHESAVRERMSAEKARHEWRERHPLLSRVWEPGALKRAEEAATQGEQVAKQHLGSCERLLQYTKTDARRDLEASQKASEEARERLKEMDDISPDFERECAERAAQNDRDNARRDRERGQSQNHGPSMG